MSDNAIFAALESKHLTLHAKTPQFLWAVLGLQWSVSIKIGP